MAPREYLLACSTTFTAADGSRFSRSLASVRLTESTEAAPTPTDMPTPKPEATPREGPFGSIAPGPAVRTALPHKAPKEVAQRTPLPSCGQYGEGPNEATTLAPEAACFADAVSTKRPAEVVHIITSTEGGTIVELFRYAGSGNVVLYMDTTSDRYSAQNWTRTEGKLFVWDHSISVSGDAVVVA